MSLIAAVIGLAACQGQEPKVEGYEAFVSHVESQSIGGDADQWIEMKNLAGEWERTGLIFGYLGDFEECQKAIEGLAKANTARQYRCVPANAK
jgi:hypothetical protein